MKATLELELYKAYAAKLESEFVVVLGSKYGNAPSIYAHLHSLWIDAVEETLDVGERSEK